MYIEKLTLKNYRNYEKAEFNFNSGINILVGDNGQGKTNCAEAIFYLCTGYSPKATRDKQLIKDGEESFNINCNAISRYGTVSVDISYNTKTEKSIKVNGVPLKKIGELMGNVNSVFFNPSELKLIKESPEDRRRFMDIAICQTSKTYFYALQKYRKILEQRNNLLKNPDREVIFETLPLWDDQLCTYAEIIVNERKEFLNKLCPHAKQIHNFLTGGKEELELSFELSYVEEGLSVKDSLVKALSEKYEKDIVLGYTSVGPHRDDIKIKLNGIDVRIYGSQGQQRTSALSLKLAELEIFNEKFNEYPVLILDDALSELDKSRRKKLLEMVSGMQTIITCTEFTDELPNESKVKYFEIENGVIKGERYV